MLTNLWTDSRYAIRMLRRQPGFAAAAVLPIALGVGLTTGVFSLIDSAVLQPIPVPKAAELVSVYQDFRGGPRRQVWGARSMFSLPEVASYRDASRTLSGVAAYSKGWTVTLAGPTLQEVEGIVVTCSYFDVLQVRPALGTGFTAANCEGPAAPPAVIVSHGLWTRVFGADPAIVGRAITLNGQAVIVVGVAPAGFEGIEVTRPAFFASTALRPAFEVDPELSWLAMVGRRRPEAGLAAVRAELAHIAAQIDRQKPGRATTPIVAPATSLSLPVARAEALVLAAIVLAGFGMVLLIACANVANVLLARAAGRTREIAVRLSMGAPRRRLVQQFLTEALIIAAAGGLAGSLLAWWSFRALIAWATANLPAAMTPVRLDVHPTANVFWFGLGLTVVTALVCGLVPALNASRPDVRSSLNGDDQMARGRAGWVRGTLISVQVTGCMVLLVSAALLLRALHTAQTRDPGFDHDGVAVVSVPLRGPGVEGGQAAALQERILAGIEAIPGVRAVARVDRVPLTPGRTQATFRLSQQEQVHEVDYNAVGPKYFSLLRMPIVKGRGFASDDLVGPPRVVVVTEATARRYWPGQDAIGRVVAMGDRSLEVVGVARDAHISNAAEVSSSYFYLPAGPRGEGDLRLLARVPMDQSTFAASVGARVKALAPGLVVRVHPLEDNLKYWETGSRLIASVSGSLGLLALALAAVGVSGVVGFVVNRRRREIGIRMALGATRSDVHSLILRQTLRPVLVGVAAGVVAAGFVSRAFEAALFGVSPIDPAAFLAAAVFLVGVACAATIVPTRAALRTDPTVSLRRER
jgi:predicted permease